MYSRIDQSSSVIPVGMAGSLMPVTHWFVGELATKLAGRIQLASDGHEPYLEGGRALTKSCNEQPIAIKPLIDRCPPAARFGKNRAIDLRR